MNAANVTTSVTNPTTVDSLIVTEHLCDAVGNSTRRVMQVTLHAEKSLNALTLTMIRRLTGLLEQWHQDDSVVAVLLDGSGNKAFCAGGDIRSLYTGMTDAGQQGYCLDFFSEEYRLNYRIHCYAKPLICWGSGLVMGGGVGLMAGAGYRVVTETSRISMPEVSIGLFPDVGGTWFLNHMPGRWGLFFALSACAMNARDARFMGLADFCLAATDKSRLLQGLCQARWGDDLSSWHETVSRLLNSLSCETLMPESQVVRHEARVNRIMHAGALPAVVAQLRQLESEDPWLAGVPQVIDHASPAAMSVIARQLHAGRHWSLKEVFQAELSLAMNISKCGEFAEGIRALLIDKDRQPRWRYASLPEVDQEWLDALFRSRWTPDQHPLADL